MGVVAPMMNGIGGRALRCGHFIAEEVPEETLAELRSFLTAS